MAQPPGKANTRPHAAFEFGSSFSISVPQRIMAILYSDPIAAGLARGGEIRFDAESGLSELLRLASGMGYRLRCGRRQSTGGLVRRKQQDDSLDGSITSPPPWQA